MKTKIFFLALAAAFQLHSTPTEWHIQEKGWDTLMEDIKSANAWESGFDSNMEVRYDEDLLQAIEIHLPLIWEIIEQEKEPGFFGYHAADYSVRIYQEILKCIFTDLLKVKIPADFSFFRIPSDPLFTLKGGTKGFFQEIESKNYLGSEKLAVQFCILYPFNQEMGCQLAADDFNERQLHILSSALLKNFALFLPKYAFVEKGVKQEAQLYFPRQDTPQIEEVAFCLHQKIPHVALEKVKHFVEKILALEPFMQRFGALSGSPKTSEEILSFFMPFNNYFREQQPRLLSLNFSLLGNANDSTSFTLGYFLDPIASMDTSNVRLHLSPLFEEIGLDLNNLEDILTDAEEMLASCHWGCLYQFFDKTPSYILLDQYSYVSASGGIPYPALTPSDVVEGRVPLYITDDEKDDVYLQMRLVLTQEGLLNPHSGLRLKFYDLLDPATRTALNSMIHRRVQSAVRDPAKLSRYQAFIKTLWP